MKLFVGLIKLFPQAITSVWTFLEWILYISVSENTCCWCVWHGGNQTMLSKTQTVCVNSSSYKRKCKRVFLWRILLLKHVILCACFQVFV